MPLDSEVPTGTPLQKRYRFVSKIPQVDPTCKLRLSAPAQGQVSAHRLRRGAFAAGEDRHRERVLYSDAEPQGGPIAGSTVVPRPWPLTPWPRPPRQIRIRGRRPTQEHRRPGAVGVAGGRPPATRLPRCCSQRERSTEARHESPAVPALLRRRHIREPRLLRAMRDVDAFLTPAQRAQDHAGDVAGIVGDHAGSDIGAVAEHALAELGPRTGTSTSDRPPLRSALPRHACGPAVAGGQVLLPKVPIPSVSRSNASSITCL